MNHHCVSYTPMLDIYIYKIYHTLQYVHNLYTLLLNTPVNRFISINYLHFFLSIQL